MRGKEIVVHAQQDPLPGVCYRLKLPQAYVCLDTSTCLSHQIVRHGTEAGLDAAPGGSS